jgi:hypothetical protein
MSELKPTCCVNVPYGNWGRTSKCSFKAKANEGGQWYCMIHAPSKVAAKNAAKDAAFEIKKNARHAARAAQKELERRAACFDDLLEALKNLANIMIAFEDDGSKHAFQAAKQAIAKAEGKQT